jgi:excisionase family DNA binding protein
MIVVKTMYDTTRICKCCGKSFKPKFGRQVYCSPACREQVKKKAKRLKVKAEQCTQSLEQIRAALSGRTHLSISEAALYVGVSRPTIYTRIKEGELVPVRFATRTLRIPIEQLDYSTDRQTQPSKGDFSILISKEDALKRYEISDGWLYRRLKSAGIRPRIIKGKAFFPKKTMDEIFPIRKNYNPDEWYDAKDLMNTHGLTRKAISDFIRRKNITCRREGRLLLVLKEDWDRAKLVRGDIEKNYLTVDQARKLYHIGQKTFYEGVHAAGLEGIRQRNYVYYSKSELDKLFKDKTPKIPWEIRRDYIRNGDALKKYHIGQKRFSEETKAAGVTKIRTAGNFVWYKKSELDELFNKISDHESR